jgi:hypothetical protein
MKPAKNHYVDNAEFLQAIKNYRAICAECRAENKPIPKIPDYMATCLMLIAKNLANKPNFYAYTFKDEMIGDAIENCIMYFHNFDPDKSSNPFAYFTQIIYYAFLRRIQKEKKQLYVKYKSYEQFGVLDDNEKSDLEENGMVSTQFEMYENISEFIDNYEETNRKNKMKSSKAKKTKLELLFDEEDPVAFDIGEEESQ